MEREKFVILNLQRLSHTTQLVNTRCWRKYCWLASATLRKRY